LRREEPVLWVTKTLAREKTGLFPEVKRKSDFERTGWSQKEKHMWSSAFFTGLCRFRVHLHNPRTDPSSHHIYIILIPDASPEQANWLPPR